MRKVLAAGALMASLTLAGCGGTNGFLGNSQNGTFGAQSLAGGSGLSLFVEPDDGVAPIVDAINGAQQSVLMEMYLLSDQDVLSALEQAAQRGVDVRVILDSKPYGGPTMHNINQKAMTALQSAGAQVHWSNPAFTYTHEKAFVIDGTESIITTTNMSKSAFSANREYGLVDTNPAEAQAIAAIFQADWNLQQPSFDDPSLVVSPVNSRGMLENLIQSAQRSLLIEDEECNDPEVIQMIGQKAQAGVNVEVLLAGPTNGKAPSSSDESEVSALQNAGVTNVKLMTSLYLHGKAIVVDGTTGYVGSVNLSATSMDKNREVGLIIKDSSILSTISSTIQSDFGESQAIGRGTAPSLTLGVPSSYATY